MEFRLFVYFLDFMGILSARVNGNRLKVSNFLMASNLLKVFAFVFLKKNIFDFLNSNSSPSFSQMKFSPFSLQILRYHAVQPIYHACVVISLQLLGSFMNVSLINQMLSFRCEMINKFPKSEMIFMDFQRTCVRSFVFLLTMTVAVFTEDFALTMKKTFLSVLSSFFFNIPYLINMLFIYYVYVAILFVVYSQKAINLYSTELPTRRSSSDMESIIGDVFFLRAALYSIKEYLITTLCLPLLVEIFDFVSEAMFEVKTGVKIDFPTDNESTSCRSFITPPRASSPLGS